MKLYKIYEGEKSTERRSTRPENMENENSMSRLQIGKRPKIWCYLVLTCEAVQRPWLRPCPGVDRVSSPSPPLAADTAPRDHVASTTLGPTSATCQQRCSELQTRVHNFIQKVENNIPVHLFEKQHFSRTFPSATNPEFTMTAIL